MFHHDCCGTRSSASETPDQTGARLRQLPDGATLVVATHDLATVSAAERVIALRDGEVIFDGPAKSADAAALVVR